MKKLLAILLSYTALAAAMTGCGDGKTDSESESKSSDIDEALIGRWYNEDLGGSFCFEEDNTVVLSADYSSIMYFDEDQNFIVSTVTFDSEYDGTTLSVTMDEDDGADEETLLLEVERIGDADEDSIDGEYTLVGGDLYDELTSTFSEIDADFTITIDGELLYLNLQICEYKADGETVEFTGEGVEFFEFESEEDAICEYEIDGDTLTLTENSGSTLELTKQ